MILLSKKMMSYKKIAEIITVPYHPPFFLRLGGLWFVEVSDLRARGTYLGVRNMPICNRTKTQETYSREPALKNLSFCATFTVGFTKKRIPYNLEFLP